VDAMPDPLLLVVAALAGFRLTRLLTADFLFGPVRAWADRRGERLGYLASCDWCSSIWLVPLPVAAIFLWPSNRLVVALLVWLAGSAVVGLVATWERSKLPDETS